ncbi:MAG: PD-(D/E)XK nuclease family transposase [Bacteroidota bacterium]
MYIWLMAIKGKYINPFTDFGFKKLFGTEPNKDLLVDFLNQVLGSREQIKDLSYLNSEQLGKIPEDRKAIFDLYCENEKGEKFVIELQNVKQQFFKDRSIFYSTFPIQRFQKKESELKTHFDKWLYVLKNLPQLEAIPKVFPEKIFKKLFKEAEIAQLNPKEMETYEESLKTYWDNYSILETAKKEGTVLVAKRLKEKGVAIKIIIETTGLSKEEIEKL